MDWERNLDHPPRIWIYVTDVWFLKWFGINVHLDKTAERIKVEYPGQMNEFHWTIFLQVQTYIKIRFEAHIYRIASPSVFSITVHILLVRIQYWLGCSLAPPLSSAPRKIQVKAYLETNEFYWKSCQILYDTRSGLATIGLILLQVLYKSKTLGDKEFRLKSSR